MNLDLNNKGEILDAITNSFIAVRQAISQVPSNKLSISFDDKWSIEGNLIHLIKSNAPVASALKVKDRLKAFGTIDRPTKSYAELTNTYSAALKTGVKAGPRFSMQEGDQQSKDEAIGSWEIIAKKFEERLENWSEQELDEYALLHPALGKLSVREMLFFTILHNYHHLNSINTIITKLGEDGAE